METEGEGGNSPVTPNEDDLLTGAGAADVETGIASLHVDSPAKPRATMTLPPKKTDKRGDSLQGASRFNWKSGSFRCTDEAE